MKTVLKVAGGILIAQAIIGAAFAALYRPYMRYSMKTAMELGEELSDC